MVIFFILGDAQREYGIKKLPLPSNFEKNNNDANLIYFSLGNTIYEFCHLNLVKL